ncbi:MAG: hypothetical protein JKY65_32650 [Planctomycetes bacterium]|nr:hypothetical protein [Planctomycetota bacterium]
MNFFGHACVALERRADAGWVLGAMTPDFATMGGVRLVRGESSGSFGEGVAFHHATDEAFHGAPTFLALMREARIELQAREVGTGASLGISHVGVELLLDGCLVERLGVPGLYREALRSAERHADELRFRGDDEPAARARWLEVCQRLQDAPVPECYTDPDFVAARLVEILARRPRLSVEPGREQEVHAWATSYRPRVAEEVDALLAEVEQRLAEL